MKVEWFPLPCNFKLSTSGWLAASGFCACIFLCVASVLVLLSTEAPDVFAKVKDMIESMIASRKQEADHMWCVSVWLLGG